VGHDKVAVGDGGLVQEVLLGAAVDHGFDGHADGEAGGDGPEEAIEVQLIGAVEAGFYMTVSRLTL